MYKVAAYINGKWVTQNTAPVSKRTAEAQARLQSMFLNCKTKIVKVS
jgi:hypothetical protein